MNTVLNNTFNILLEKQNQNFFCSEIQKYGCRFRCLQAIAEIEENKNLTCEQIQQIYDVLSSDQDILNKNCRCGYLEHYIINETFHILGNSNKKARQVGMMESHIPKGWDGKTCSYDYIIFHWKTQTKDGHYTLVDKNGMELFDPWNHEKKSMKKEKILRKLLYKVWTLQ